MAAGLANALFIVTEEARFITAVVEEEQPFPSVPVTV
jgi:hypothetical protein